MIPILGALQQTDWKGLERYRESFRGSALPGWSPTTREAAFIRAQQPVISLIGRSASLPVSTFPNLTGLGPERPLPRSERILALQSLLMANVQYLVSQGYGNEALARLLEMGTLGTRFARPESEASWQAHGIAITTLDFTAGLAGRLAASHEVHGLGAQELQRLELQLAALEAQYLPLLQAARSELVHYQSVLEANLGSRNSLAVALQFYDPDLTRPAALEEADRLYGWASSFPAAMRLVADKVLSELSRPPYERQLLIGEAPVQWSDNPLAARSVEPLGALAQREAIMLARLRLARAAARLALNPAATINDLVDPFSGEPLQLQGQLLYSVGPDRFDNDGREPSGTGPWADSDIVLRVTGLSK
jgi:hypothetical protein